MSGEAERLREALERIDDPNGDIASAFAGAMVEDEREVIWNQFCDDLEAAVAAARKYLAFLEKGPNIEAAVRAFYEAVDPHLDANRGDFVKMPLMSQAATTDFMVRRGVRAAVDAALSDYVTDAPASGHNQERE